MKIEELRINNYVISDCHHGLITSIHTLGITSVRIWCNPLAVYKYHEIQGIPLTPEILEKAGFGKWPNGYWCNGLILTYYQCELVPQIVDQIINYKPVKYLHQLQNLYHGLTQSELEINL